MVWVYQPQRLRDTLEAAGFDVDTSAAILSGGGSLSARRQRGEQATVVSLDAGGRFLATLTTVVDTPSPETVDVEGVQLRVVPELTRTTVISGQLTTPDQLAPLLEALPSLAAKHTKRTEPGDARQVERTVDQGAVQSASPLYRSGSQKRRPWWRSWR